MLSPGKSSFARFVVRHPLRSRHPTTCTSVPPWALLQIKPKPTDLHTASMFLSLFYYDFFFAKQYIQIKDWVQRRLPSPPPPTSAPPSPAQISPDSRSSELERERRSRSNDSDLSRSLSLALSAGGDTSLSTQSLSSAFSSRHPSSDGKHSLSRVWDDLSLEDLWEKHKVAEISQCWCLKWVGSTLCEFWYKSSEFGGNWNVMLGRSRTSSFCACGSGSVSDVGPCVGVFSLFLGPSHGLGPDPALALLLLWSEKSGGVESDESRSWLHPCTFKGKLTFYNCNRR